MEAFADDGVVRVLTEKMQLCKAASQRTTTWMKTSERRACLASKGPAAAAGDVETEKKIPTPPPSVEDSHRYSIRTARNNVDESGLGGEGPKSSSAKLLEQQKIAHQALSCCFSCGRDAGVNRAQQKPPILLSRAAIPMFTIDSSAKRTVSKPAELGRGDHMDVDGCARTAELEDGQGGRGKDVGGIECQRISEPIRADSNRRSVRGINVFADAPTRANDGEGRNNRGDAPPLVLVCSNHQDDDGLETRTFDKSNSNVDSPCNESSTLGDDPTVPSSFNEELPPFFSSRDHHRQIVSGNDPPATNSVESTGTTTKGTPTVSYTSSGPTTPPSPVGAVKNRSLKRGDISTAATRNSAFSSRAGVLGGSQPAGVEESVGFKVAGSVAAPGLRLPTPMSSFEIQLECGAALDQGCEQASKPVVAQKDNSSASCFDEGHDQPEGENADMSTTTAKLYEEKCIGIGESDVSTDIDDFTAIKEVMELEPRRTEAIFLGKSGEGGDEAATVLREAKVVTVTRESGSEQERAETVAEVGGISGKPVAVPAEGAGPYSPSLPALREQKTSPSSINTEDENTEEYEFTFDDEELVAGPKMVRFTDESLWSVHEVRASFEQHELGELFYTTHELDCMLEEAELEEALERSKPRDLQEEDYSDDAVRKKGLGVGAVLEGVEHVSVESLSIGDSEESDYNF